MKLKKHLILTAYWLVCLFAAWYLLPQEWLEVKDQIKWFPDSVKIWQYGRIGMLGLCCFTPVLAAHLYYLGSLLDRYMARMFLQVLALCSGALLSIWFLMDLASNLSDFQENDHVFKAIALFYTKTLPGTLMLLMPYVLLLSLLYHLRKVSADRELVAMIQTGYSLMRLLAPQLVISLLCSLVCIGLNYHMAPKAVADRARLMQEVQGKAVKKAQDVLYFQSEFKRLWLIKSFPEDFSKPLEGVHITITSPEGALTQELYAEQAQWNEQSRIWTFYGLEEVNYSTDGIPKRVRHHQAISIHDWEETPAQLVQPSLLATDLGLPDLSTWLDENEHHTKMPYISSYLTHWHYRWALPLNCLVIVLLAVPLAIDFSRKASAQSVLLAVIFSALMMLCSSISLSLGESAYLAPFLAAWLPNILFTGVALCLMVKRMELKIPLFKNKVVS